MLGKLIRYDAKVQIKFLGGIALIGLLISLISAFMQGLSKTYTSIPFYDVASELVFCVCVIASVLMIAGVMIYSVLYFRKNLFKDEGYLMHTLPVKEWQLYLSKLLTASVCVYLSVVCAFLFIILGSRYFELSIDVLREIFMERKGVGAITGVTLILSVPFYLCQLYASLVMGYTWKLRSEKMNRDVLSVIVFAIIYLIQQVIGVVILIAFAGAKVGAAYVSDTESFEISLNVLLGDNSTVSYQRIMDAVFEILAISLACSIIVAVVLATLSIYKMKRSLDLQ